MPAGGYACRGKGLAEVLPLLKLRHPDQLGQARFGIVFRVFRDFAGYKILYLKVE